MAYDEFTVHDLTQRLGLRYVEVPELFRDAPPVMPGAVLVEVLRDNTPVALAFSTEKARSEFLIAPILMEAPPPPSRHGEPVLRRRTQRRRVARPQRPL